MARIRRSRTGSAPAGDGGYTLTELLVVLAIMGMVAALAPPVLGAARAHVAARAAVLRLAGALQAARERAVATGSAVTLDGVTFFPDGSARGAVIYVGGAAVSVAPFSGRVDVDY